VVGLELEIAAALVTVFTLAVTVISARSYLRTQSVKVLIVTTAFAMFFVKGVVISLALLREEVDWEALTLASLILDAIVAILLFIALVARKQKGADKG
jgi:hypothetical protein